MVTYCGAPCFSAPPRVKLTRVVDIDLTASKTKGQRQITAQIQIRDDRGYGVTGATVHASWVFPDGSVEAVQDTTRSSGFTYFTMDVPRRGTYTFRIDDVVLQDHQFDPDNSVLSASIKVK